MRSYSKIMYSKGTIELGGRGGGWLNRKYIDIDDLKKKKKKISKIIDETLQWQYLPTYFSTIHVCIRTRLRTWTLHSLASLNVGQPKYNQVLVEPHICINISILDYMKIRFNIDESHPHRKTKKQKAKIIYINCVNESDIRMCVYV